MAVDVMACVVLGDAYTATLPKIMKGQEHLLISGGVVYAMLRIHPRGDTSSLFSLWGYISCLLSPRENASVIGAVALRGEHHKFNVDQPEGR